jgi:hypothetical protein
MGFRFDVLLASPEDLELVGAVGKTPLLPRTVLLDREGRAVLDQIGYTDFQVLEKKILELLSTRPQKKVTISLSARLLSEAHLLFVLGRAFTARPPRTCYGDLEYAPHLITFFWGAVLRVAVQAEHQVDPPKITGLGVSNCSSELHMLVS